MRKALFILLLGLALFIQGCCSGTYKAYLKSQNKSLKQVRASLKKGLDSRVKNEGYDEDFAKNDLGVIDDIIDSNTRIIESGEVPKK